MKRKSLISFFVFQARQVKNGDFKIIFLKICKRLPFYFFAFPLILFFRLIRPFKLVRFGYIRSDVIGNSVFDAEYYLSERELEKQNSLDLFYFSTTILCNEQWATMIRRHLHIYSFVRFLDDLNQLIPGGKTHIAKMVSLETGSRDNKGVLYRTKPHSPFTEEENKRGNNFLKEIGMKKGESFVCLLVRDAAYKSKYQNWIKNDWSYHNYRDSNVNDYIDTTLILAEQGHRVFRMGKEVDKPFRVKHPQVMDYANSSYRTDFLDIWLMANCRYCITTGTGLDDVCVAFRRPLVEVNYLPIGLGRCNQAYAVDLFKYLKWKSNGKLLSLDEIINTGAINFCYNKLYEDMGIEIIDNTSEEIVNTVVEMEGRLNGTWIEESKDIKLQKTFWEKLENSPHFNKRFGWIHPKSRISAYFLRKNHKWFFA